VNNWPSLSSNDLSKKGRKAKKDGSLRKWALLLSIISSS
jgi:hypothetical protein